MSKHEPAAPSQESTEAFVDAGRQKTARLREKGQDPFANDVLTRECSAAEKADVLAYLLSLK